MRQNIASASQALPSGVATDDFVPTIEQLQRLDELRSYVETLQTHIWDRLTAKNVETLAYAIYFNHFYGMLLATTEDRLTVGLQRVALNPLETDDFHSVYDTLKSYLITTTDHERSTKEFLGPVLYNRWSAGREVDKVRAQLIHKQFDFYATQLKAANPYSFPSQWSVVEGARRYLRNIFTAEQIYHSLLNDAANKATGIRFNVLFPASSEVLIDSYEVPAPFTKPGYAIVQGGLDHLVLYAEFWVIGTNFVGQVDTTTIQQNLTDRFRAEYIAEWNTFLRRASFHAYLPLPSDDAEKKLNLLAGPYSPVLALLGTVSRNTAVLDKAISSHFQSAQMVVPPESAEQNQYVGQSPQPYLDALDSLKGTLKIIRLTPNGFTDPSMLGKGLDAAAAANSAARALSQSFAVDEQYHNEVVVEELLQQPITNAEVILKLRPGGSRKSRKP